MHATSLEPKAALRAPMTASLTCLRLQHGHAKANITGVDIFTGNKYMDVSPTSHTMSAPVGKLATLPAMLKANAQRALPSALHSYGELVLAKHWAKLPFIPNLLQ